jgi:transposase
VREFLAELEDRTDLSEEQHKSIKKEFFSDVKKVKDDLMEGTNTCLEEFRGIVEWARRQYLPNLKVSVPYDLKADPFSFFSGFMYLHRHLKGKFRLLPLIDSVIPKSIELDTQGLQQLFQLPVTTPRDEIWNQIFKMNHRDFRMKNRTFHYLLHTDMVSTSLVFEDPPGRIRQYRWRGKTRKKKNKKWKDAPVGKYIPITPILPEDLELLEQEVPLAPIIEPILRIIERAEHPRVIVTPFIPRYLESLRMQTFSCPPVKPKTGKKGRDPNLYVQPKDIRGKTIVGIDPNKEDLLSMVGEGLTPNLDKQGRLTTFRYTKCQKNFETRSRKNRKQRDKMSKETLITDPVSGDSSSIKELESTIPSKKTADPDQFRVYLLTKIRVSHLLSNYYRQEIFRKMKWHTFINTQRSEAKLVNNFATIYGQPGKVIVCFGDYNQAHLKHCEPVKGKYYRDLFKRNGYEVFLVDEHKTSITCHDCLGELDHCVWRESPRPWVRRRSPRAYPVHGLLRCKTCLQGRRKWNRDVNAARNIRGLAICAFNGQERPKCFQHQKKRSGPAIAGQAHQGGSGTSSIQGRSMTYANPTLG